MIRKEEWVCRRMTGNKQECGAQHHISNRKCVGCGSARNTCKTKLFMAADDDRCNGTKLSEREVAKYRALGARINYAEFKSSDADMLGDGGSVAG